MKRVLLALLVSASSALALPTYDYFNYTAGQTLSGQTNSDGLVWVGMNNATSTAVPATIATPDNVFSGASVPTGFPKPNGNAVEMTGNFTSGTANGSGGNLLFGGAVTNGQVYASFFLTVSNISNIGSQGAFWATF